MKKINRIVPLAVLLATAVRVGPILRRLPVDTNAVNLSDIVNRI
jgi:hypothetical protein